MKEIVQAAGSACLEEVGLLVGGGQLYTVLYSSSNSLIAQVLTGAYYVPKRPR